MNRRVAVFVSIVVLGATPLVADAFPFGGRASTVLNCVYNSTIYTNLGPPRGGEYIWTTATRTYEFGPPSHAGQWMLGLAGAPYFCVYSKAPLIIYTGIAMIMMGSSGPAAPSAPRTTGPSLTTPTAPSGSPGSIGFPSGTVGTPSGSGSGSGTAGRLLVSEVYYAVDSVHGTSPANQWVELYNGTATTVNLSGWALRDSVATSTIPAGTTVAPGQFAVLISDSNTSALWSIPAAAKIVVLGSIGNGLSASSDAVFLKNPEGNTVDAVSWGGNTSAFSPAAILVSNGSSLARSALTSDTNTGADWASRPIPNPGQ